MCEDRKSLVVLKDGEWPLNGVVLRKGDEFDTEYLKLNRFHVSRYFRMGWIGYGAVSRSFDEVIKKPVVKKVAKKVAPKTKSKRTVKPKKD